MTRGKIRDLAYPSTSVPEPIRSFFFGYAENGNPEASYQRLMDLGDVEIRAIKFEGKAIWALATLSGWPLDRHEADLQSPYGFRRLVSWIFGKEYRTLDRHSVEEYFFNRAGYGKKEASYRELMNLSQKEIGALKIQGEAIVAIAKKCGYSHPMGTSVQGPIAFRAFISWLFGKEYRELDSEMVRTYFFNFAGPGKKEASYALLMSLDSDRIQSIKIQSASMVRIAKISGWSGPDMHYVRHPVRFREFINWMFDKS